MMMMDPPIPKKKNSWVKLLFGCFRLFFCSFHILIIISFNSFSSHYFSFSFNFFLFYSLEWIFFRVDNDLFFFSFSPSASTNNIKVNDEYVMKLPEILLLLLFDMLSVINILFYMNEWIKWRNMLLLLLLFVFFHFNYKSSSSSFFFFVVGVCVSVCIFKMRILQTFFPISLSHTHTQNFFLQHSLLFIDNVFTLFFEYKQTNKRTKKKFANQ